MRRDVHLGNQGRSATTPRANDGLPSQERSYIFRRVEFEGQDEHSRPAGGDRGLRHGFDRHFCKVG